MSLTSIIRIIRVNEKRSGTKDGRAWELQDCECLLMTEDGEATQVGVLSLPKAMRGDNAPKPGVYLGAFALQASLRDRRIEAILTGLQPYAVKAPAPSVSSKAA